jgi:hypothetical protein
LKHPQGAAPVSKTTHNMMWQGIYGLFLNSKFIIHDDVFNGKGSAQPLLSETEVLTGFPIQNNDKPH